MTNERQRYLDARVEGAEPFVAGVQHALDETLSELRKLGMDYDIDYSIAVKILEKVKKG